MWWYYRAIQHVIEAEALTRILRKSNACDTWSSARVWAGEMVREADAMSRSHRITWDLGPEGVGPDGRAWRLHWKVGDRSFSRITDRAGAFRFSDRWNAEIPC